MGVVVIGLNLSGEVLTPLPENYSRNRTLSPWLAGCLVSISQLKWGRLVGRTECSEWISPALSPYMVENRLAGSEDTEAGR
jgi:hypothetical protein